MDLGASVTTGYRVAFADTDASGRLYWGAMFRIFEEAEAELWRSLDALDVYVLLPRAHAEAQYRRAMRFDDRLQVTATLTRIGRTSVDVTFGVTRDGEAIASGMTTAVWVDEAGTPLAISGRLSGSSATTVQD